jgi:heme oxygenase
MAQSFEVGLENLRERLRQQTRPLHDRLEDSLNLTRPDWSLAEYRTLLQRFYGFYAPLERRIARVCDPELQRLFADRRKVPSLLQDLAYFHIDAATVPHSTRVPRISSAADALGAMYVTEGATLGGQLLSRHVERVLSLSDGRGYSFWSGYGTETGRMWTSFLEVLASRSCPALDVAAISSAVATFTCLEEWLLSPNGGSGDLPQN